MEKSRGFTYLEMIIVVLIIGIISTAGLSSYAEFNARKQTESEALYVVDYLQTARQKTSSSDKPASCSGFTGSYSVSLTGSTMSLVPGGCSTVATHTFEDFVFSQGDFSVAFAPLGGGASGDSCIIVAHPKVPICEKITIESSGIVDHELLSEASCTCP